ncbi:hypothetical protein MRX96_043029 [Rhipicephalus microplus]
MARSGSCPSRSDICGPPPAHRVRRMPRSGRATGLARSGHLCTEGSRCSNGSWRRAAREKEGHVLSYSWRTQALRGTETGARGATWRVSARMDARSLPVSRARGPRL